MPRGLRIALAATVVASLAWTATHREDLREIHRHLDRVAVIFLVVAASFASSAIGVVLLLARAGPTALREIVGPVGDRSVRQIPRRARTALDRVLEQAPHDRWFRAGWLLSSLGGLVPSVAGVVGVLWILPRGSWGLAVVPAVDLVLSLVIRATVHRRLLFPEPPDPGH